jgi:hypothetical protein
MQLRRSVHMLTFLTILSFGYGRILLAFTRFHHGILIPTGLNLRTSIKRYHLVGRRRKAKRSMLRQPHFPHTAVGLWLAPCSGCYPPDALHLGTVVSLR